MGSVEYAIEVISVISMFFVPSRPIDELTQPRKRNLCYYGCVEFRLKLTLKLTINSKSTYMYDKCMNERGRHRARRGDLSSIHNPDP